MQLVGQFDVAANPIFRGNPPPFGAGAIASTARSSLCSIPITKTIIGESESWRAKNRGEHAAQQPVDKPKSRNFRLQATATSNEAASPAGFSWMTFVKSQLFAAIICAMLALTIPTTAAADIVSTSLNGNVDYNAA